MALEQQSPEIATGVHINRSEEDVGAGDQVDDSFILPLPPSPPCFWSAGGDWEGRCMFICMGDMFDLGLGSGCSERCHGCSSSSGGGIGIVCMFVCFDFFPQTHSKQIS